MLAYLLLHRHTPVSRQHLAFTLWPDSSDSQARMLMQVEDACAQACAGR